MKTNHAVYEGMLKRFLAHQMSPQKFQTEFFQRFQNEGDDLDESMFLLLYELFGDLDCFTEDTELLAEKPEFYLDAKGLEREAADTLLRL
jgi:hypothetical protein